MYKTWEDFWNDREQVYFNGEKHDTAYYVYFRHKLNPDIKISFYYERYANRIEVYLKDEKVLDDYLCKDVFLTEMQNYLHHLHHSYYEYMWLKEVLFDKPMNLTVSFQLFDIIDSAYYEEPVNLIHSLELRKDIFDILKEDTIAFCRNNRIKINDNHV